MGVGEIVGERSYSVYVESPYIDASDRWPVSYSLRYKAMENRSLTIDCALGAWKMGQFFLDKEKRMILQ